jgi:hypothetical protein
MSNVTSERGETQSPVAQVKEQVQDAAAPGDRSRWLRTS